MVLLRQPRSWLGVALAYLLLGLLGGCRAEETSHRDLPPATPGAAVAVFAGGCFWCMEPPFDRLDGVFSTTSGYAGGHVADPGYKAVTQGGTGHLESVRVEYDPEQTSFAALLEVYWRNIDPLDASGQFCDRGQSYRAAIFFLDEAQRRSAEASYRRVQERFQRPLATVLLPLEATGFYAAETGHQDYYRKNPVRYKYYRRRCGRDARLEELWGAPGATPLVSGDGDH